MYLESQKKDKCNGCGACINSCPKNCIDMIADEEGFLYPHINEKQCIHCGICEKVCSNNYSIFSCKSKMKAYAGIYKNEDVVEKSASGGVFTAIYENLLKENYWIAGVAFDKDF